MSLELLRLRSADPSALQRFYSRVFDAKETDGGCMLGAERIDIDPATDPLPDLFQSNETGFQHFALVVADMRIAYARLCACPDWRPISTAGPERLPASSGGATAFKFRDPEGHPLELLQFSDKAVPDVWRARFTTAPHRVFFGIDHSGIAVLDVKASVRFWNGLGFVSTHRQMNRGPEQARLDGLADIGGVEVEIVSLSPTLGARPGVELLAYRRPLATIRTAANGSTAATEIVLAGARPQALLLDPDGHRFEWR